MTKDTPRDEYGWVFDPVAVANLAHIIDETGADIVISSSWKFHGVPKWTINSIVNANKVFGLKSFTIISQEFHNERAIYQAEHLGLDVEDLQAYNAKMPKSRRAYLTSIREYFARVKMFWDLL